MLSPEDEEHVASDGSFEIGLERGEMSGFCLSIGSFGAGRDEIGRRTVTVAGRLGGREMEGRDRREWKEIGEKEEVRVSILFPAREERGDIRGAEVMRMKTMQRWWVLVDERRREEAARVRQCIFRMHSYYAIASYTTMLTISNASSSQLPETENVAELAIQSIQAQKSRELRVWAVRKPDARHYAITGRPTLSRSVQDHEDEKIVELEKTRGISEIGDLQVSLLVEVLK
nr:hypothetical protein Iba_chr06aCG2300 [Ipomoea batatas]